MRKIAKEVVMAGCPYGGEGKAILLSYVDAAWRGAMHAAWRAQQP